MILKIILLLLKQSGRNDMAWVAVHKNGKEGIFSHKPERGAKLEWWYDEIYEGDVTLDTEIPLPIGSIKKLIGRDLDWNDEPVELKEE